MSTIEEICSFSFFRIFFLTAVANNHVLNTVLIKLLFLLGNDSLFIARLPNLLALSVYLYFSYKITSKNLPSIAGIGSFFLLICNPFLLEFFGLARGYGLSLAFMMGALYFAAENVKEFSQSTFFKSLIWGALSVLTVFSMLYFWVALAIVLNVTVLLRGDRLALTNTLRHSIYVGLALALFISLPLVRMIIHGKLYYGGHTGFYKDTLISLTQSTLYIPHPDSLVHAVLNIYLAITTATSLASWFSRKQTNRCKNLFLSTAILSAILIISAHHLTGTLYPINRVALFFYPLLILPLCFGLSEVKKWIGIPALALLVTGFSYNLLSNSNFYKTDSWPFDAHSEKILEKINQKGERENRVMSLQIDWAFQPSIGYYLAKRNFQFVELIDTPSSAINLNAEYYLFLSGEVMPYINELREERGLKVEDLYTKKAFLEYPEEQVIVFDLKAADQPALGTH